MNPKLQAILKDLDSKRAKLAAANSTHTRTNDRLASTLRAKAPHA